MDIPSQLPGQFTGLVQQEKSTATGLTEATPYLDVDLIKKLGLRQGSILQAVIASIKPEISKGLMSETQWQVLLEITRPQIKPADQGQITEQTNTPVLLQVISSKPVEVGQLLVLLLDRNNRLQLIKPSPLSNDRNIPVINRSSFVQLLNNSDRSEMPTQTTGVILQKLLDRQSSQGSETIPEILQQLPNSKQIIQQLPILKNWITQTVQLTQNITNMNFPPNTVSKAKTAITSASIDEKISINPETKKWEKIPLNLSSTVQTEKTSGGLATNTKQPDKDQHLEKLLETLLKNLVKIDTAIDKGKAVKINSAQPLNDLVALIKNLLGNKQAIKSHIKPDIEKNSAGPMGENQSELFDILESMVNRNVSLQSSHQLNNVSSQILNSSFKCDIPIWHQQRIDNVQLTIEKDQQHAAEKSQNTSAVRWRIVLDFDLKEHGLIQAEALIRETRVNIALWAEKDYTRKQIENRMEKFSARLLAKGLPLESLHCRQHKVQQQNNKTLSVLLDTRG